MTQEQFDNYKFSINTEIKYKHLWLKVISIDFCSNSIQPAHHHHMVNIEQIEDIRN